jgi:hypothetical protein
MKRNACFSFLDLEAGHSGHVRDCDNTNAHESQGSLLDFVDDGGSSGNCLEDDMTGIYLTSLMPISQQPEGFGFYAPKYNNKGFKLRKSENQVSPQSPTFLCPTPGPIQLLAPLPPIAVCRLCSHKFFFLSVVQNLFIQSQVSSIERGAALVESDDIALRQTIAALPSYPSGGLPVAKVSNRARLKLKSRPD